ncbi:MAG: TolC family protein [Planctomycetaceae bacterium]|nr:TolC family protein [Planctomycetaceae bacterium]
MVHYHFVYALGLLCVLTGCRSGQQVRDPEYAHLSRETYHATVTPFSAHATIAPVDSRLEGPHSVEEYVQVALQQNPEVQAARKRMESLAHKVPVAASLPDPMLTVTAQPAPVQTAAGEQQFILSASQKLPWAGKLDTQAAVAEAQTNVGRAQLASVELATIAKVKRAYYELYFLQHAIVVTESQQQLLGEIRDVANTRYKTGRTSQQDVLRADLEISKVENDLIQLRQQLASGRARLARLLHIAPESRVEAVASLPDELLPQNLAALQQQAVAARPELHAALATVFRDQHAANLARLDYKPDVTLGFSWIDVADGGLAKSANGQDALLLTAGINLPVYKKRLDSSLRSAEAGAVASARNYDALKDGTLEEVTDLFARTNSHQQMLTLFEEDILPKARQTLQVSSQAYNVGEVDFLQLIDNWQQLLRYEVNYRRLEANLRQSLAELEQVVGGWAAMNSATPAQPEMLPVMPVPVDDPGAADVPKDE